MRAKKGIYGMNDAPLLWYQEHRDTILSLPGAERSKLCPALFIFREAGRVIGLIGTHVDDDLVTGTKEFFENQVAQLRKLHVYGKWQYAEDGFHHCGRHVSKQKDHSIKVSQEDYAAGIEKIPVYPGDR